MRRLLTILLCSLIFIAESFVADAEQLDGLSEFIEAEMEKWDVPGLAVAVIKDGEVIYKEAFGVSDLTTGRKVTTETIFSIASSSKAFSSACAGILHDRGKLDLNASILDILPEFRLNELEATRHSTLSNYLSHSSGLPRHDIVWDNEPATREELLERIAYLELLSEPGTKWSYSNLNYIVAGAAIEKASDMKWEDFVRAELLSKIGMEHTYFSIEDTALTDDFAKPYIMRDSLVERLEFKNSDVLGPAGCIRSNINDMSKWLLFNLNRGRAGDEQIINPRTHGYLQHPLIVTGMPMRDKEVFYSNYGCGWFIDSYKGNMHIHHGGVLFGFSAMVSMLPEEKAGVVILANLNGTPLTTILEYNIYDRLLDSEQTDWSGRYTALWDRMKKYYDMQVAREDEGQVQNTSLSHDLDDYTGIFEHPGYGAVEIVRDNDSLIVRMTVLDCPAKHYHYDVFKMHNPVDGNDMLINFSTNDEGKIDGFSANFEPKCERIVFKKRND